MANNLGSPASALRTPVYQDSIAGVTSSAPVAFYNIPVGSTIKIYPTSAGAASVYSSSSNILNIQNDVAAGNSAITSGTNAKWDQWSAGSVSASTIQQALMGVEAIALVVTSGTWTIEVVTP